MTSSLPTSSDRAPSGASVEMLREDEAEPILNVFRGLPPGSISPSSVEVQVVNGTGVAGQAAAVTDALAEIGFEVGEPASLDERYTRTTVRFGAGADGRARLVARHVTGGAALLADPALSEGEVVLVTGADLTTLHTQPSPEGSADDLRSTTSTSASTTAAPGNEAAWRPSRSGRDHDEHDRGRLLDRRTAGGRRLLTPFPDCVTDVTLRSPGLVRVSAGDLHSGGRPCMPRRQVPVAAETVARPHHARATTVVVDLGDRRGVARLAVDHLRDARAPDVRWRFVSGWLDDPAQRTDETALAAHRWSVAAIRAQQAVGPVATAALLRRYLDGDALADYEVDQPEHVRDAEQEMEATIEDLVWLAGQVPALPALVVGDTVRPLARS